MQIKDLFKLFGEIYNPKNLDEALSLKKVEDKFSPTAIIVDAEKPLRTDEYYQDVLLDDEQRYIIVFLLKIFLILLMKVPLLLPRSWI